jgi:hypothetical protein
MLNKEEYIDTYFEYYMEIYYRKQCNNNADIENKLLFKLPYKGTMNNKK